MQFFVECTIVVLLAVSSIASAEADSGYFIPKAFYTLDAEGHKTEPHLVSPHTAQYLRRIRRQVFSSSSSSSSSSASSSNGGPVYFSSQSTVSHTPGGTVSVSSRFGGDGASSTTSHSSSGVGSSAGSASGYAGMGYGGSGHGGSAYGGSGYGNTGYAGNSVPINTHRDINHGAAGNTLGNQFGSSVSSSSAVSSNGGPVYFKTEQSVAHTPSNINVNSRFGGDIPHTVGKTVSTSGFIDEKGVVHAKTTTKNH